MRSFFIIMLALSAFFSASLPAKVIYLGLKSNYEFKEHLEQKLAFGLSDQVNRRGQLLVYPNNAALEGKKLVVGIIEYPDEKLYAVENKEDLDPFITTNTRSLYYLIAPGLIREIIELEIPENPYINIFNGAWLRMPK